MARYNESFNLNTGDIALIESALRQAIGVLARNGWSERAHGPDTGREIREMEELLGKLHNQKIWYGQVHHTGVPLG